MKSCKLFCIKLFFFFYFFFGYSMSNWPFAIINMTCMYFKFLFLTLLLFIFSFFISSTLRWSHHSEVLRYAHRFLILFTMEFIDVDRQLPRRVQSQLTSTCTSELNIMSKCDCDCSPRRGHCLCFSNSLSRS